MEPIDHIALKAFTKMIQKVPDAGRLILCRGIPEGDADPEKAGSNLRMVALHVGDDVGEPEKKGFRGQVPMSRAIQVIADFLWPTRKESDFYDFSTKVRMPIEALVATSEDLAKAASTWYLKSIMPRPFQGTSSQIVRMVWVIEYKNFTAAPARFI